MTPKLDLLQAYPFERLSRLLSDVVPTPHLSLINLSIGEPAHASPECVKRAIVEHLDGLSTYPATAGTPALREAIAAWLRQRHGLSSLEAMKHVLPALGSREALFAAAQVVLDGSPEHYVVCPNPFYQIYEGAALLAGGRPWFVNARPDLGHMPDWEHVPDPVWERTRLLYVCTPGNPAGEVMTLEHWARLFEWADRYNFVIASDECYSEIYLGDTPPLGGLGAAQQLGRTGYERLLVFSSLSKRSNVPGLRSGFIAGDAHWIARLLRYRTYHGSAMSPMIQAASIAAWSDEQHVIENRSLYRAKFDAVLPILQPWLEVERPNAGFYLWPTVPLGDETFIRRLLGECAVKTLPGSYLARETAQGNPGAGRIRLALVAPLAECIEGAKRIADFVKTL